MASIRDPNHVQELVRMVLEAPVDQTYREQGELDYFIVFHIKGGPPVTRAYWFESGDLSGGILLPDEFRGAVESALRAAQ